MESEFAVESCVAMSTKNLWDARRGNAVRVVRSSSDAKERHRLPCTQEDIGCLLAISGRSEAEVL